MNTIENNYLERSKNSLPSIKMLYDKLYATHPNSAENFEQLKALIDAACKNRCIELKRADATKLSKEENWFLSNNLCGMSLYVDRFCGTIKNLENKLDYFENLGVNFLHLMPIFESPKSESDGGYAVSDFRKIDEKFGTLTDLKSLQQTMHKKDMCIMLDIVLNHTSHKHEWAMKAKAGEKKYQDYFYFFDDRLMPDQLEKTMPEVFPESSPGNFTYVAELNKWVMTVFHHYQWDLNYKNPAVFNEMLDNIFYYANLGVDVLRIDAPAFLWKTLGTNCQNLYEAHLIIQLIKQCVQAATPGMALLAEAIVSPTEIMKYFGENEFEAKESDFAYNATQMALQWDALATGDTKIMLAAQSLLLKKPYHTSWITYTRCHDDIGLGYDDYMIDQAGYNPYEHRTFLKNYYSGKFEGSPAKGALFSVNEKTGDARISGSLASLCGLEKAIEENNDFAIDIALKKIILMQAQSVFIGGLPMLYYGDEVGYTNDYNYLNDKDKDYDNRWMHRPLIDWEKNNKYLQNGTIEKTIFELTKKLLALRKKLHVLADKKNITWINTNNKALAAFLRAWEQDRVYCLFNFSNAETKISWYTFKQNGLVPIKLFDHWSDETFDVGYDHEHITLLPYQFYLFEPR
jgi:amylosucrase